MSNDKGFTLMEMMIVTLIIGVLGAIAAPGWATFVNGRRVSAANDAVLGTLRQAQSEAKRTKLRYSASFKNDTVPKFAVHPANTTPTIWESLIPELKPGQVTLGVNLTSENTASTSFVYGSTTAQRVTFNHMGALDPQPNLGGSQALIVAVAIPQSSSTTTAIDTTRRCVKVMTLLGAAIIGKVDECNAVATP